MLMRVIGQPLVGWTTEDVGLNPVGAATVQRARRLSHGTRAPFIARHHRIVRRLVIFFLGGA